MAHRATGRLGLLTTARQGRLCLVKTGQSLLETAQVAKRVGVAHRATGRLGLLTTARQGRLCLLEAGQSLLKAAQAGQHTGAVHQATGCLDLLTETRKDRSCLLKTDEGFLEAAQAGQHAGAVHRAAGCLDLLAEARVEGLGLLVVGQGILETTQRRQAVAEHLGYRREAGIVWPLSDLAGDQRRELRELRRWAAFGPLLGVLRVARSQVERGGQAPAFLGSPPVASGEDAGELGVGTGADVVTQLLVVHLREVHVSPLPAPTKEPPPEPAPPTAGEAAACHQGSGAWSRT